MLAHSVHLSRDMTTPQKSIPFQVPEHVAILSRELDAYHTLHNGWRCLVIMAQLELLAAMLEAGL